MRIDILFPVLPPTLDGIGDHTARIAAEMSPQCDVRILTAQASWTPITGVRIEQAFSLDRPWQITAVVDAIRQDPPDWLVLQFNQFSYGRWGLNPFVPVVLRQIRRVAPTTRIAWMAHEDFVPATSAKFAVMRLWQKAQFRAIGAASDVVFFSIDPWVKRYGSWFPDTPVFHNPIGSNMPYVPEDGSVDRTALGVDEGTFLAGFFGTLRARHLSHVDAAMHAMTTAAKEMSRPEPVLLYVGPNGPEFKDALPDHSVIDAGRLPAEDVSRHFRVMDLQFAPFIDGVSTRRGSLMAGLQHGVPTLGTTGPLTDGVLSEADGTAIKLCPVHDTDAFAAAAVELFTRSDERRALGASGQALYDQKFAFDATVQGMLELLRAFDSKPGRPLVAA